MIGAICPNFSDKKVKAQFEELKELFGEDKAYLVWHRNNGNPIDKAPNGAESILFLNLLEELKGDRSSAIIAKTKIYTSQFLDNFGNWIDLLSADDIADKVDSNGEPLLQFVDYKSVKGTDSPLTSQVVQHLSDTLKQIGLEVRSKDDMRSFLSAEDRLVLAFIGKKARTKFEQQLMKARPDLAEPHYFVNNIDFFKNPFSDEYIASISYVEAMPLINTGLVKDMGSTYVLTEKGIDQATKTYPGIDAVLNFLHSLEDNKENTAYIKTAIKWVANRSITLPRDNVKARQAFDLARRKHIDIQKYNTLGELIASDEMKPKKKERASFNPDKAETFSNKHTVTTDGGRIFTVYDVEDTEEGQREVCKAVAAHYETSPWCLSTFTATGKPTESAEKYWQYYNGIPRKIAFENGKPVAFSSDEPLPGNKPDDYYAIDGYRLPVGLWFSNILNQNQSDGIGKRNFNQDTLNYLVDNGYVERNSAYDWVINDDAYKLTKKGEQAVERVHIQPKLEDREAWWDMEDFRPQDTLNDSIVSEYRTPEQLAQVIRERLNQDQEEGLDLPFFLTPNGEVYGFIDKDGNIYLDETVISPEHPIHEYTHLWDRVVAKRNPKLWKRGIQLMRKTSLWKEIEESENYGKKWKAVKGMTQDMLDNLIASEVHARFVGEGGSQLLEKLSKEKGSKNIILKIKDWLLEFWKDLKSTFSAWSQEELYNLTLKDFNHMTMRDFIEGINLRDEGIELTNELRQIRHRAISNGTYMKAPNGKPTNLTERQWLQVRTKNFINWFGDWINDPANASKVVDENGEPKVVYHYTNNEDLEEFSIEFENYFAQTGGTKKAIFFTEDKVDRGTEDNFLTNRKARLAVFLNIRDLREYHGTKEDLHKHGTSYRQVVNESAEKNNTTGGLHMSGFDDNKKENQDIWIIHNPNQVKSATDNNGMFSAENDNILMFVDSTPRVSDAEAALNESLTKKMYLTAVDIQEKREEYITNAVQIYKDSVESPKAELISRIKHQSRIDFDNNELNKLLKLQQRLLAISYNLRFNSKGFYESSNEDDKNIMAEHFINSLQENTAKNYLIEVSGKPKYDRVGVPQNAASVSNVIYNAIFNGDLTTLDKALARDYVRMFWTTNLILSALDSLNDDSRSLTSLQLEDKLVDHMTRIPVEDRQNSIIDWLINIWNDLNELVKQIFSRVRFTNDQRQDILKAVDAAFMITLDLRTAESFSPVYDRQDGNFDTSKFLTVRDKNALKNLHSGLKARLRGRLSRRIRDQRLINNLKLEIAGLEGHENFTVDQIFEKIQQFLFSSNNEIGNIKIMLDEEFNSDNMDNWSIEKINFVQQDVIGFYKNSLQDFLDLFSDKTSALAKLNEIASESGDELNLHNYCKQLMAELNAVESMYKSDIVMPYCRYALSKYIDTQENITDKEAYLYNLIKWMELDASYGDVSTGELWLGMYSRSKSELVKAMDHMITEAELKTHRQVLKIGNEIMNAYERIRPKGSQMSPQNYQRFLCELDRNGVPTGYFIREINEGQFFIDKKEYEAKLREEFNLEADADGYTIFPEENYKDDNSIYNQYYDKLDAWLDKHCNRRYKLEYYLTRRRILSPQTIAELNRIQYQIDLIIDNAKREFTPGGKKYIDKSKLTMDERQQLDVLLREKRNLGEHYIFTENEDGIVTIIPKTDKALEMADEITKWNEFIAKKITYKPDWDSFRQAVAKVASESGGMDSDAVNEFKRNNTIQTLTPEFYDLLQRASSSVMYTDPEIPKLQRRYREILRYVKAKTGSGQANLFKFGLGIGTDTSAWLELSRLEQEISDRKRDSAVSVGNSSEDGLTFDEFAAILPVTVSDDDDTSFISYLINQWNKVYHGASTDGRFNELFTYINPKGRRQHLKAFDYLSALDYSIKVDGKVIKLLEPNMPISEYSVLDDASEYVNENFDSAGNAMLPKARNERGEILYEDLRFKLLTAELLQFRNMLLDYMDRFNAMIPNRSTTRDYLRPLISGSYATVFMNTMRGKELGLAFKYAFRKTGLTSLTNELAETDEDVSTNEDIPRRPDGTPINNIPIRFIRKLPNPAMLTGDVVGSVIMFADMAYNYYNKASLIDTLELLKYAATPNQGSANSMKNQFAKIDDLLNYRYFGKETTFGFNNDAKITPAKQRTLQGVKFFKRLTQTALLGWNFTTVEVGFLDALLSMFADAIGAKYITYDDFKYAFWECFAHTYGAVHGFGKAVVDDKLVAAMQYNGLSKNNRAIFRHTEKSSVKRLIGDTMSMGGYTLSDYMINGAMLAATYHTFRLIQTPDGSAKFYSRHQAINKLTKLGMTENEADYTWSKSKITLWDAYEVKDGYFTLRDEYRGIVNEYLENIVAGRLRDRTAIYNGVVPEEEKARIYKNMVGSFLTMMRGFYINTYWERYGNDNHGYAKPGEDRKTSWRNLHKQDEGTTYNFLTGENSSMVFKSFVRGTYILCSNLKNKLAGNDGQKLTLEQNYAVRRLWTELAIIGVNLFLMMFSTLFARSNDYEPEDDDDKIPVWMYNVEGFNPFSDKKLIDFHLRNCDKKFLDFLRWKTALLSTKLFTERMTSWYPPTVLEIIQSPSVANSYIKDLEEILNISDLFATLFTQAGDEQIKRDGYKGSSRRTKVISTITKPTGVNAFMKEWHTAGIKAKFNTYRKMHPADIFVPTQSEWEESQKEANSDEIGNALSGGSGQVLMQ